MLIAWMTTGSLGMMVARYLKKMAKGKKMCDKDLWFVVRHHRQNHVLSVQCGTKVFVN